MRTMTGNFSMRGNDDRLQSQGIQTGVVFQLIDGFFEKRPSVGIANEQPPVLDLDIMVENGVGRGVHIGDKSVLVDCDRGKAHCIERGGRDVPDPGAPATEAISIRLRVKEARMRSSSARRSQISEFMSKTVILKCSITVNISYNG